MKSTVFRVFARLCLGALLILSLSGLAAAAGLELKNEAFQDVVVKGKDGKTEKKRQPVTNAVPGSEILYVISYRNGGAKPAANVVINNPVPTGLAYVPGSAEGKGARVEVSVDGGQAFGTLDKLRVSGKDGKTRPARGDDVSHVRWTLQAPVPAGQGGSVSYRAVVR